MAFSSGGGGGGAPMAEINVTPLVDVMLVLLIIFMVAAPLMMVGVPLQLPKTTAAKVTPPKEPLVVSIDKDGKLFIRKDPVEESDLIAALQALNEDAANTVIYVRGDKTLEYGRIMDLMSKVGQAGFGKISLVAEGATPPAAK